MMGHLPPGIGVVGMSVDPTGLEKGVGRPFGDLSSMGAIGPMPPGWVPPQFSVVPLAVPPGATAAQVRVHGVVRGVKWEGGGRPVPPPRSAVRECGVVRWVRREGSGWAPEPFGGGGL